MAEKNMNAKISVEFEETANRQQLSSGDNLPTLFGKIKKFFTDLKSVAFSGSYIDLSDKPTTATTTTDGLMSAADKAKLDGADNKYALKSKYGNTTINVGRKAGTTVGSRSTAEGDRTTASGDYSHAEGRQTTASGESSHASGYQTQALHDYEASFGTYNESNDNTIFSVGDGTADDARHNAFEITTDGGKLHDKDIAFKDDIPSSLPANGGNADTVNGHTVNCDIPDNALFTDTINSDVTAIGNPVTLNGLQGGVPFSDMIVSGKNLLKYPYYETTKTVNGITFTDNGDGTITVNGTATAKSNFYLYPINKDFMGLCDGVEYTLSGNSCVTGDIQLSLGQYSGTKWVGAVNDIGNGKIFNISHNSSYDNLSLSIYVASGAVCDNIIIRPQIEIGSTATEYEPPITGREITLTVNGNITTITPDSNPYVVPNDIRQVDGLNNISISEGEISVTGVRKNAAVKNIWDKIDELTTAIIVSNGEI